MHLPKKDRRCCSSTSPIFAFNMGDIEGALSPMLKTGVPGSVVAV